VGRMARGYPAGAAHCLLTVTGLIRAYACVQTSEPIGMRLAFQT
jgi:hypothetical protein